MQVFLNLLDQLKQAKAGDKKSGYADLLWQINDRMELIMAHFSFDPDDDKKYVPLFRESTDVRLAKLEERIRCQKEEPAAAFVDAVNGGIRIIDDALDNRFKVFTKISFNMHRRIFEVELGLNIWGSENTPSKKAEFAHLLDELQNEGFEINIKGSHPRFYDTEQNRSLMEHALTQMFEARGIRYEIYNGYIDKICFIVRPENVSVTAADDSPKEKLKKESDVLSEDEVYELQKEISTAKSAPSMMVLDKENQNLYIGTLRYNICHMEEIMGCEDLSICRDIKRQHREEREKNQRIWAIEKEAQKDAVKMLKDREFVESIPIGLARFVRIKLSPLFLDEFNIKDWNVVEFSLGPNRMPCRGPYKGVLDCFQVEDDRMPAAVFSEKQIQKVLDLLHGALPSAELISAEADFRHSTPLISKLEFRLNDPKDFAELMRHLPEKDGNEEYDLF